MLILIASIMIALMLARREPTLQAVELTRVTSDAGFTAFPALSRDGRLLVYASDRGGGPLNLWVQQVGLGNPVRITDSSVRARLTACEPWVKALLPQLLPPLPPLPLLPAGYRLSVIR